MGRFGITAIRIMCVVPNMLGKNMRADLQADLRGVQPVGAGSRPDAVGSGSIWGHRLSVVNGRFVVIIVDFFPVLSERWLKSISALSLSNPTYPSSSHMTRS